MGATSPSVVKTTLPCWRPRERLGREGAAKLSDPELWMCVLGVGRRGRSVESQARWLSEEAANWSVGQPMEVDKLSARLGVAQAARVQAVLEIAQRQSAQSLPIIAESQDVLLVCQPLHTAQQETLMVLYCATRGQLLRAVPLALGSINMVGIRPHDIFANALDLPVDSIVMCHNHPSGDAQPSPADIVFTRRIQAACSLMGYWLRDHIIMARREYYSFREQHTLDMTGD